MYHLLRERGRSVEAIGCAVAPRTVYEATLEGHRAARKLGAPQVSAVSARSVAHAGITVTPPTLVQTLAFAKVEICTSRHIQRRTSA